MSTSAPACLASVIIPVFNGADHLPDAVASVAASIAHCARHLPAAGPDAFEIIVADDGSTDDTKAVVQALAAADPRIRLAGGDANRGAGPARNAGVTASAGEILFFLDADDRFRPPHILACLQELLRHPEAGLVKTGLAVDAPVTDEWLRAIERSVVFNTALWRRCHDAIGGFLEDPALKILRCEDVFYCDLLIQAFPARFVAARTVDHRVRPGGAFDQQRTRFASPLAEAPDVLTPEQKAVLPHLTALHQARRAALGVG